WAAVSPARPSTSTRASTPSGCSCPRGTKGSEGAARGRMTPPGAATGRALTERAPQEHAPTGCARSLSVIVPTHGRAALLRAVVEGWLALAPSLEPATAFELVVV